MSIPGGGPRAASVHPVRRDADVTVWLRRSIMAAGLLAAAMFPLVGLVWDLQLYADGSLFSYAVTVEESWSIHWHNIVGRVFVYLATCLPAEILVRLTGHAGGGIALYGLLFFGAQVLGLAATFATDRSHGRIVFVFACVSTLIVCPLVFAFPTEMWFAHALFWPLLAFVHLGRTSGLGGLLLAGGLSALLHTHGGGVIFATLIVLSLLPRGVRDPRCLRAMTAFLAAMGLWIALQMAFRPDAAIAGVLFRAAFNFIDPRNLATPIMWLLLLAAGGYVVLAWAALWWELRTPHATALAVVCGLLLAYWWAWDTSLHTDERYLMRTAILVITPVLGSLAAVSILRQENIATWPLPLVQRGMDALSAVATPRLLVGVIILVTLVHTVETAQFVGAWSRYRAALLELATGDASDPALGHALFVSSGRLSSDVDGPSWSSTTHFLSVVGTPGHNPARLVVNPHAGYFWLSCSLARRIRVKRRTLPETAQALIERHSCLQR